MRPTSQILLGKFVVARGGARFFQTLETFKEHTLAYALGAVIDMLPRRKKNSKLKAAELPRRGAKASSTDRLGYVNGCHASRKLGNCVRHGGRRSV